MNLPHTAFALFLLAIASPASAGDLCGVRPNDWCPAPAGDPCGRHADAKACKADKACYGQPYRGESFVACKVDERGFGLNCPTVGCTSEKPKRRT